MNRRRDQEHEYNSQQTGGFGEASEPSGCKTTGRYYRGYNGDKPQLPCHVAESTCAL